MDPHKTGPLNQPPPAHNAPSQYPPPQGMAITQAIPSGYNLPKPAHTGSTMGMVKTTQSQGLQQGGGPPKAIPNLTEKSYPMMPPKSATPPNHSPNSAPMVPKMPQIPTLIPSASSKAGCGPQPQQSYQQFQQRLNPQLHFQQQTSQQNFPVHTNQSQVNTHTMPPYPQVPIQKVQQLSNQTVLMSKPDLPKGPTPPIPDLISIAKPAITQSLPPSTVKTDTTCQQFLAKIPQNISAVSREPPKSNSNSDHPSVLSTTQSVQISTDDKTVNSSTPLTKVSVSPTMNVVKPVIPAPEAVSIIKKPDAAEVNEIQDQSVVDKTDKTISVAGINLNGVPPKTQIKPAQTGVAKSNVSPDSKPSGETAKKNLPAQPIIPTKSVTPIAKVSPIVAASATVPPNKAPIVQAKPAVSITSLPPTKSSQPLTKPTMVAPKPVGITITSQHVSPMVQASPKSVTNVIKPSIVAPSTPVLPADSNIKNADMAKVDANLTRTSAEIIKSKPEIMSTKPQKLEIITHKPTKVENVTNRSEISTDQMSKVESAHVKLPTVMNLTPKVAKTLPIAAKSPRKKPTSNIVPKEEKIGEKPQIRGRRTEEEVPKTPSEGQRKSKRTRNPAPVYQSPAVDSIRIPKSLTMTPKDQEKLIVFFKNEHVAVRNPDGAFYICQLAQNVHKNTRKLKIRWLSPTEEIDACEIFKPDYYDVTDFDCILTSVRLEKVDRATFRLPPVERERILNILKRALDKEQGINDSKDDLAEDHPDGLDISLYKDEAQLKKKKKTKRSPRAQRAVSEETTDEDSEEMKDLGDDSEDDNEDSESEVEEEESEEEIILPPVKARKIGAKRTPRNTGRAAAKASPLPPKKEVPKPAPTRTPAPARKTKRSAAAAVLTDISPEAPPAKVARTLRNTPKVTTAKANKPVTSQDSSPTTRPKTTRRTRK